MNRTKYALGSDYITHADLHALQNDYFTSEELKELNKKWFCISQNSKFGSEETLALAERMFKLGYLSAHMYYPEND